MFSRSAVCGLYFLHNVAKQRTRLRCVALRYVIPKFLRVNLFLWGHELRFFCLEYVSVFCKWYKNFSCRHRLHSLLALSYGLQFLITFHCVCTWKNLLASLRVHICFFCSHVGRMSSGFCTVLWSWWLAWWVWSPLGHTKRSCSNKAMYNS